MDGIARGQLFDLMRRARRRRHADHLGFSLARTGLYGERAPVRIGFLTCHPTSLVEICGRQQLNPSATVWRLGAAWQRRRMPTR